MRNSFISILSIASSTLAMAQDSIPKTPVPPSMHSNSMGGFEQLLPVFPIVLFVVLVISVTKYLLDFRLKNKIIDRGISEQLANSILAKSESDKKDDAAKWAFLLIGLSGGLIAAYYTAPLDIHSLAIIVLSIGLSFMANYFYLTNSRK